MLKKVKSESSIRFFAVADFEPKDTMRGALRLKQGDAVEVLERDPSGWWCVLINENTGWAPSTFLDPCCNGGNMYTVLQDTGCSSHDFATVDYTADRSQPFGENEEERDGYLTLGREQPVDLEDNYVTLRPRNRATGGSHAYVMRDTEERTEEDLYLELETSEMCIVNRAGVETDSAGYVKITSTPLPVPSVPHRPARPLTSTGSSVDNSRSPSPADSPVVETQPIFPPVRKQRGKEEQPHSPAIPPRRLPRQPLNKMLSRDRLFEGGSPKMTRRHVPKSSSDSKMMLSSPKRLLRSSTDPQLVSAITPRKPIAMNGAAIPEEEEPFNPTTKQGLEQRHSSGENHTRPHTEHQASPRLNRRRCVSDETPSKESPHSPRKSHLVQSEMPASSNAGHFLSTLGNMLWFHGKLSRQKAESRLHKTDVEVGDFLVRESESQPGNYTMSVRNLTGECLHFKITVMSGGEKFAIENTLFSSIDKIIQFYKTHDIFETEGQRLKLNNPVKKRVSAGNSQSP